MCLSFRTLSTLDGLGQHRTRLAATRLVGWLILGLGLLAACHPLRRPWDPDPGLPPGFESPRATFRSWVAAGVAGDEEGLAACYWDGLGAGERAAWLAENLRPEAKEVFSGAKWLRLEPVTPVEVRFAFETGKGNIFRGVMVRTNRGWKIQSW